MLVKRETIDKNPHIITDYMYNGDNIGIDLNSLNNEKSNKIHSIPSLVISSEQQKFDFTEYEIGLNSTLKFEEDKVQAVINVTSPNDYETIRKEISDEDFAQDMIKVCLYEKKNIKNLPCFEKAIQEVIDNIKETALSNNYLIRENVMNYKCYIYSENMELLGVANRLLNRTTVRFILGEYIGKTLEKFASSNDKIIIDMCINDNLTLQITNVKVDQFTSGSVSYALLDTSFAKIKQIDDTYTSTTMNIPKNISLPNYHPSCDTLDYYDKFINMNSRSEINNFYKLNKPNMTPTININKYLIG